jgi:hypothetical protein
MMAAAVAPRSSPGQSGPARRDWPIHAGLSHWHSGCRVTGTGTVTLPPVAPCPALSAAGASGGEQLSDLNPGFKLL